MKKSLALIASLVFLIAISLSSCKSTADCPAYSKVDTEQAQQKA